MAYLSTLTVIAAFFSIAMATPVIERAPTVPSFTPTSPEYYLKTKVLSGDASKDGLYVAAYHTGAGLNDATLTSDKSVAAKGFYNKTGTFQEFDLGNELPYGMSLVYQQYYTKWLPVAINAGPGDAGFSIMPGTGLVSSNPEWRGWLACDWYHVVPQLFWVYYFEDFLIPCSCARIELCPESV